MDFFNNNKKHILLTVSVLLLITAFFTYGRKSDFNFFENALAFMVTPLQDGVSKASSFFSDKISSHKLNSENNSSISELLLEIQALEAENGKLSERLYLLEDENDKLSELLGMAKKYPGLKTIGVRVTARDPGNWYDSFMINRGKNDGVSSGMPLIDSAGLAGVVTQAGKTHSKAQSILDSHISVSAVCMRTGDTGIVSGDYTLFESGLCRMGYISPTSSIVVGDEIFTSYLSDIYPAGITIGVVTEISLDNNGLSKTAVISPAANLKQMDSLLLITDYNMDEAEE